MGRLTTLQNEVKVKVKVKVKLSLDRSLGLLEVEAPRISGQSAHEVGMVSLTNRPSLTP